MHLLFNCIVEELKNVKALVRAYMSKNLGDDLFIYILCKRYKNHKFYVIGNNDCKYIEKISNAFLISSESIISIFFNKLYKLWQKIKGEEICYFRDIAVLNVYSMLFRNNILISGSFYIQNKMWKGMEDALWYESRPYILGCNFGPYTDERYLEENKKQLQKAKQISWRDKYSYELFKDINNSTYAPDVVFNLDISNYEIKDDGFYIISIIDVAKEDDEQLSNVKEKYYYLIRKIISTLKSSCKKIVLFSFGKNEGDTKSIEEILSDYSEKNEIEIFEYGKEGIEKSLQLISRCSGIVASRYHAVILGFLFKKKVLPLCYSDKLHNVLNDLDYSGEIIDLRLLDQKDLQNLDITFGSLEEDILERVICDASIHFSKLDKLFGKKTG